MDYSIGQLAALSGVTVRTLHHYEKLGLLSPTARSPSGYRRYTERDVVTLHRILACKQMGLGLREIASCLGPEAPPLQELLARQAVAVEAEIGRLQRLLAMLDRLAQTASDGMDPGISPQLLNLMKAMQSLQQHYSSAELTELKAVRDRLPAEDRQELRKELASLLQAFSAAKDQSLSFADAEVKALARRWLALGALAPSSADIRVKTRALLDTNPEVQRATGIGPALKSYIDQAVAVIRPAKTG